MKPLTAVSSLHAAGELQLAAPRDTTAAREAALNLGHDQDVGGVDLFNGVAHRDLLLVRCWCHGVDLGLHLADPGGVNACLGLGLIGIAIVRVGLGVDSGVVLGVANRGRCTRSW